MMKRWVAGVRVVRLMLNRRLQRASFIAFDMNFLKRWLVLISDKVLHQYTNCKTSDFLIIRKLFPESDKASFVV